MRGVILRIHRRALVLLLVGLGAFTGAAWLRQSLESRRTARGDATPPAAAIAEAAGRVSASELPAAVRQAEKEISRLQSELLKVDRKLAAYQPKGNYIVIDSANNRLWLKRGDTVLREAVCSTGSGKLLEDPAGGRSWLFSTPRGEFKVENRLENPLWRKPDWAFIEEGEPVPGKQDAAERFEEGMLGEYALGFGDGYLIHGTLYTRLLGKSVTHGCVRLGAEDLRLVYEASPAHTKVLIY